MPGWAASLGVGLAVYLWDPPAEATVPVGSYDPGRHAIYWFGGFCAVSVFGGLIGLVPAVRRTVGRFRPITDPADRRGFVAALITHARDRGSTVLAGVAGVLTAATTGTAAPPTAWSSPGWPSVPRCSVEPARSGAAVASSARSSPSG